MRSPPDAERAAPAGREGDSLKSDHAGELICPTHRATRRGVQRRCEACSKTFDKKAGRRRRFCSDACRVAAARAREARKGSEVECSIAFGNAQNSADISKTYKAKEAYPCPSIFSVPLNLLGSGRQWPGAPTLDRATREKILWREACAP